MAVGVGRVGICGISCDRVVCLTRQGVVSVFRQAIHSLIRFARMGPLMEDFFSDKG